MEMVICNHLFSSKDLESSTETTKKGGLEYQVLPIQLTLLKLSENWNRNHSFELKGVSLVDPAKKNVVNV